MEKSEPVSLHLGRAVFRDVAQYLLQPTNTGGEGVSWVPHHLKTKPPTPQCTVYSIGFRVRGVEVLVLGLEVIYPALEQFSLAYTSEVHDDREFEWNGQWNRPDSPELGVFCKFFECEISGSPEQGDEFKSRSEPESIFLCTSPGDREKHRG
ncbi:hypothetical protein BDV98DRAFT_578653 [Pterulicium gracile]|uniref:Uncharacterized protein n=1 Tax=Pterulicium gracile TaxID=1884261 RepID=A0A5C3QYQ0_9AGAR|nr:hypothetical protein BDV98DRAFT_578653 [Pterula gracilis]